MAKLTEGVYEKYGVSYKTLTLTDGDYALTVTPEKGGMATSFTKAGEEYLWLRDKNFESTDRPRCGVPILFPNCGKPDNGVHIFNGQAYPMEIHGMADLCPWEVESVGPDGVTLIPVSRLSFGFGCGGGDYGKQTPAMFGGASTAGVKVEPVAFLVVKDGVTRVMPVALPAVGTVDRVIDLVPQVMDRVENFIDKKKAAKETF